MQKASGTHIYYTNKEAKVDVDIAKIVIENLIDGPEFRLVFSPSSISLSQKQPDNMIKVRIRDKYVFVKEAPWRVYDQFEVFMHSTDVYLTRRFYQKVAQFLVFNQVDPNTDFDLEDE
jgi:hypothetical protein